MATGSCVYSENVFVYVSLSLTCCTHTIITHLASFAFISNFEKRKNLYIVYIFNGAAISAHVMQGDAACSYM